MKKITVLIILVIGMLIGAAAISGVYLCVEGDVDWKAYAEETVIPAAVTVTASILTIYFTILPVIKKIIFAAERFGTATDEIRTTELSRNENARRLDAQDKKISAFSDAIAELHSSVNELSRTSKQIEQIARLGFCNIDELVKKGYASEILKVSEAIEKNEKAN